MKPGTGRALRVLVVDDHEFLRALLCSYVQALEGFELVEAQGCATVSSAMNVLTNESKEPIDVVILDLQLPFSRRAGVASAVDDGVELGSFIARNYPATRIMVLTQNLTRDAATRCAPFTNVVIEKVPLLADGDTSFKEALDAAVRGESFVRARDRTAHRAMLRDRYGLTERHLEVLDCVAEGLGNSKIAARWTVSVRTIEDHKREIADRITARDGIVLPDHRFADRGELIVWFVRQRLEPRLGD